MTNEIHDRRVQRTRKILHEALIELILEKGFDKVTVQDVIKRANVGRSTFYSHYKDTEDLFLSGFENLWSLFEKHLTGQIVKQAGVWDLSLIVFQHAQNYTGVYKALAAKPGGQLMSTYMHKYLSALIRETLKDKWTKNKQIPLEIVVYHLASSLIALLGWWVDHDLPYSPQQMNEMYQQLTQPAIDAIV
ncbi:MAG: TetR/AcrR family transcriptional regulator [Chloroflexota bacterium]